MTLRAGKATIGALSRQGDYVFEREWSDFGPLVLAYVDILGWSDLICSPRTIETADKINSAILELMRARELAADRDETLADDRYKHRKTVRASFFSDTMIFTCKPDLYEAGWLVSDVQRMCWFLLSQGLYTRGAIVTPDVEPLLVGPRVRPTSDFGAPKVRIDPADGRTYLDAFGDLSSTALRGLKSVVEKDIAAAEKSGTAEALYRREKYLWMGAYLERALADLAPPSS